MIWHWLAQDAGRRAGAATGRADVLWGLFCPQFPRGLAALADLVIRCHEKDLARSLELAADLAVHLLLVGLHRQKKVAWLCRSAG
jgi:hypothetical protein